MEGQVIGIELSDAYAYATLPKGADKFENFAIPSYVAYTNEGRVLVVGEDAKKQFGQNPENTIYDVVHLIGRGYSDEFVQKCKEIWSFSVTANKKDRTLLVKLSESGSDRSITKKPSDICAEILKAIKERAKANHGVSIQAVVVTVPAIHFNKKSRSVILEACKMADLKLRNFTSNTISSAHYYDKRVYIPNEIKSKRSFLKNLFGDTINFLLEKIRSQDDNINYNIVIFDLGAQTLDVSIVPVKANKSISVLAAESTYELGASDFIEKMVEFFEELKESFIRSNLTKSRDHQFIRSNLTKSWMEVMGIFHSNSSWFENTTPCEDLNIPESELHKHYKVLFKKCSTILKNCLNKAEKPPIHDVIFTGHSEIIPLLSQTICNGNDYGINIKEKVVKRQSNTYPATGAAIIALQNHGQMQPYETVQMGSEQSISHANTTGISTGNCNPNEHVMVTHGEMEEQSMKTTSLSSIRHSNVKEYAIGIDFGTTYSCVAVWQHNGVRIIENEYGKRLTKSIVAFNDSSRLLGDIAIQEEGSTDPANSIPNIKRLIGRNGTQDQSIIENMPFHVEDGGKNRLVIKARYKKNDKDFTPEEIASMVLSKMKNVAKAQLGSDITLKAVISVPACFNDSQRKAIMDAGTIAGLDVMQLLNESTAAAIAYLSHKMDTQSFLGNNLLIFDLGGGYLDVSIVTFDQGTIKVKAVASDPNLGGEDFDNNMVRYCIKKFEEMRERKISVSMDKFEETRERTISIKPRSLRRLRAACKKAKEVLSTNAQALVEIDALDDGIDFCITITRKDFEGLNEELFTRSMECVQKCLIDAGMMEPCSYIDLEVVLIGGSTRIPKIQLLLQNFFGKEPCKSMNVDEAVASGAAIQAALLCGGREKNKEFDALKLVDVTSLSLYEITAGQINTITPKYTPIPIKCGLLEFDTTNSTSLKVYERKLASGTILPIADFPLKEIGISKIHVYFAINESGMLYIEAEDISSVGHKIMISNGGLSPAEIETFMNAEAQYEKDDEEEAQIVAASHSLHVFAYKLMEYDDVKAITNLKKAANEINAWIEQSQHPDIAEIKKQMDELNGAADKDIAWVRDNPEIYADKNQMEILKDVISKIKVLDHDLKF